MRMKEIDADVRWRPKPYVAYIYTCIYDDIMILCLAARAVDSGGVCARIVVVLWI